MMDFVDIRRQARQKLSGNWGLSIGVAVVACLLGGLIVGSAFLPDANTTIPIGFLRELAQKLDPGIRLGTFTFSFRGGVFGLAAFILGGTLQLGYVQFLLKQHDGKDVEFHDLFSQFDRFGQGFAQKFLRDLYTVLWTLLFIIPGIVKGYSYAMTPFIMADHPELSASEAITRSRQLMNGHKLELWVLDLTFFGWALLCILTLNLGFIALNPYRNAAWAVFYRQISRQNTTTTI